MYSIEFLELEKNIYMYVNYIMGGSRGFSGEEGSGHRSSMPTTLDDTRLFPSFSSRRK